MGSATTFGGTYCRLPTHPAGLCSGVMARSREQQLEALVDIARDLATVHSPDAVLDTIVRRARSLLGTDVSYLTLFDPERGDTFMKATAGSVSADFQSLRLEAGAGLGGLAAATRKPYWTSDYPSDERFRHTGAIDSAVGQEGLVAICGTPLLVRDEFVGVLFASNRSPRPFSHDEVSLLGSLAALAAVAIVQARALDEAEKALAALSEAHDTVRRHTAGVERAATAHDRFVELVLGGGGVEDITRAVSELLGGWAVLLDEHAAVRSASGPAPALVSLPETASLVAGASGRLRRAGAQYVAPVSARDTVLGHLVVGDVGELDDADERSVERAAMVSALVLLIERNRAEAEQQLRTDLVADLVAGRGDPETLVAAARAHGVSLRDECCVAVARPVEPTSRRSVVLAASAALGGRGIVGEHAGDVVVIIPGADPSAVARRVAAQLSRSARVTVGAAGPVREPAGVRAAHAEAARTASALVVLGRAGDGAAPGELGFAGLIVGSSGDVEGYVRSVLGPLVDYDQERGTDLVTTVEAYFAAGRSPRHAAGLLHVHVNTVSQRIERVGRLLGDDWQSPARSLEVQLALQLRRVAAHAAPLDGVAARHGSSA